MCDVGVRVERTRYDAAFWCFEIFFQHTAEEPSVSANVIPHINLLKPNGIYIYQILQQ
jgi:hypothetical protein